MNSDDECLVSSNANYNILECLCPYAMCKRVRALFTCELFSWSRLTRGLGRLVDQFKLISSALPISVDAIEKQFSSTECFHRLCQPQRNSTRNSKYQFEALGPMRNVKNEIIYPQGCAGAPV